MRKIISLVTLLMSLFVVSAASAATVPVTSLSGDFGATNPSVRMTPDGVNFGPYANGGTAGGSLFYGGANGLTLADLTQLSFTYNYNTTDDSPLGAPYLRVFLNGDADDVIFDATECATVTPVENTNVTVEVTSSNVRYDDDSCDGVPPDQQPWADVVAAHGTDVVSGIFITQGFAGGLDASANIPDLGVNGTLFDFGAPVAGPTGPAGTPGTPGTTGVTTTAIIREPVRINVAPSLKLVGNSLRVLHVARRAHERFLSARATLRGKRLRTRGRSIFVDLRGQPVGNYNVRITARYRRANNTVHTVRTTRHLSVETIQ